MSTLSGTFVAKKKDGTVYYRSSITHLNKHISLGSYPDMESAHRAYLYASLLFRSQADIESYQENSCLSFEKYVSIINFRDHDVYFKNPIYLKKNFFYYYMAPDEFLIFDVEDLFFYARHKIMRRGGHLFVADYGMQVTITGRYGIKAYGVEGRDYRFINGNTHDFRYENIKILNPYHGVVNVVKNGQAMYKAIIHINGNRIIGIYDSAIDAAIAYNKAIDLLEKAGIAKNYTPNYIEGMSGLAYASIYTELTITPAFSNYLKSLITCK